MEMEHRKRVAALHVERLAKEEEHTAAVDPEPKAAVDLVANVTYFD